MLSHSFKPMIVCFTTRCVKGSRPRSARYCPIGTGMLFTVTGTL